MFLPIVTIVGRPNVGKSSLLNCLANKRISIVDPTSGVTRDRVSVEIEHEETLFELIDTGGIGITDIEDIAQEVDVQIEIAIQKASLILFVVDVRDGITPLDIKVADRLRKIKNHFFLLRINVMLQSSICRQQSSSNLDWENLYRFPLYKNTAD